MCYSSGAVQDFSDGLGGLRRHHSFCFAVLIEIALRFIEGLVAKFVAMKQVPLLDEPITADLRTLDRSFFVTFSSLFHFR